MIMILIYYLFKKKKNLPFLVCTFLSTIFMVLTIFSFVILLSNLKVVFFIIIMLLTMIFIINLLFRPDQKSHNRDVYFTFKSIVGEMPKVVIIYIF